MVVYVYIIVGKLGLILYLAINLEKYCVSKLLIKNIGLPNKNISYFTKILGYSE